MKNINTYMFEKFKQHIGTEKYNGFSQTYKNIVFVPTIHFIERQNYRNLSDEYIITLLNSIRDTIIEKIKDHSIILNKKFKLEFIQEKLRIICAAEEISEHTLHIYEKYFIPTYQNKYYKINLISCYNKYDIKYQKEHIYTITVK